MGRAFGKVMGIFTPGASGAKGVDSLPSDFDDDLPVRRADKKRGREEYVVRMRGEWLGVVGVRLEDGRRSTRK